jgi:hypothetical protein
MRVKRFIGLLLSFLRPEGLLARTRPGIPQPLQPYNNYTEEQETVSNNVDHEPVNRHLESIAGLRVPPLQRRVQGLLAP